MSAAEEVSGEKAELQSVEVICAIGDTAVSELEDWLGEEPHQWSDAERQAELEAGVRFILDHPAVPLSAQHDAWIARNRSRLKLDDPRLVPFGRLPFGMQLKARLWRHIVHAIIG